jgi:hypothetical protein
VLFTIFYGISLPIIDYLRVFISVNPLLDMTS